MYERILIVRLSHLGDVVHALPVFHALRQAYPAAELAWAIQPEFAPLVEGLPGLTRTFYFARHSGLSAWTRLRRELRAWKPDWAVDAQGNTKSAMVSLTSRAPRRSGPARVDCRERLAALVTSDRALPAEGVHAIDRMRALIRHVAPDGHADPLRIDPCLSAAERARGHALLGQRAAQGTPAHIVHLADAADVRAWPTEHFEQLVRELGQAGRRVLVLSGPAEATIGRALQERVRAPGIGHWVGQRGLRELAAVFAAAAEQGARLLACDSGPAHLAASVGLGVDLLAGPQDALRTGPWPTRALAGHPVHTTLRSPSSPECAPCLERRCHHPRGPVCTSELTPQYVVAQLLAGEARHPTSPPSLAASAAHPGTPGPEPA